MRSLSDQSLCIISFHGKYKLSSLNSNKLAVAGDLHSNRRRSNMLNLHLRANCATALVQLATLINAVFSIKASIAGVANTSITPLPIVFAVYRSVTTIS
jgi:primosomal replication protein N